MHKEKTHVRYNDSGRVRKPAEEILARILSQRFAQVQGPVLIAVGGPGGTGKSTICKSLSRLLHESSVLTLDDYKTSREERKNKNIFGAHPAANRIDLIREHLLSIREGKTFDCPVYDTVEGEISGTTPYTPTKFTILDGEISTYKDFHDLVDFSIFLDSDWKTQLTTRISRDIEVRQYTRDKAINTFLQSNLREFSQFGKESKKWADIHLYCKEDYTIVIESVATELYEDFKDILVEDFDSVELAGLVVPVTTPFDDNLKVDTKELIRHLEYLSSCGVKRILVNGTLGEFFSLSLVEQKQLLNIARRYFPGVVFFHAGCDSLKESETEIRWAEEYGADAVAVLPPYYYANVSESGLIEYFSKLHEHLEIPLILYNFPRHTQNPLTPSILAAVEHFGMKDSSGDLSLIPHTPHYYLGSDNNIPAAFQAGAHGFVSGSANFLPEKYVELEKEVKAENWKKAELVQESICDDIAKIKGKNTISAFKHAIAERLEGYPVFTRPPL